MNNCLSFEHFFPDAEVPNFTVPIVLPITTEQKAQLDGSNAIALTYEGKLLAVLREPEFFPHRKVN